MLAYAQATVRFGQELVQVEWGQTVTLHFAGGERRAADAVILALPLNVLERIAFAPDLPDRFARRWARTVAGR